MRKLLLTNYQAPGDILMLTAAVRDLHLCCPGEFATDVETSCPELWENNPHVTALDPNASEVEVVPCEYPLIHHADNKALHFIHGFMEDLGDRLQCRIQPTEFRGDIHLSGTERALPPMGTLAEGDLPYWIVVAGGKYDDTIKWWHFRRWQAVVDHFRDRIQFVQVGKRDDYHPPLQHVLDWRGRTSLREMIRLTYHAAGVLCPVTFAMHLAAAVPTPPGRPASRACVVVAGGRESPHWEAYPTHQFLHTVGTLPCCATTGCWKSRTVPLGDGGAKDEPAHLCVDVVGGLPRCMDMIRPERVIESIEFYMKGIALKKGGPDGAGKLQGEANPDWGTPTSNQPTMTGGAACH